MRITVIVQEEDFVEVGKDLGKVEAEMVQDGEVLWVPILEVNVVVSGSRLPVRYSRAEVEALHALQLDLFEDRDVGGSDPLILVQALDLQPQPLSAHICRAAGQGWEGGRVV